MSSQKLVNWQNNGIENVLNNLAYGECKPNVSGMGKSCTVNFIDNGTPCRLVIQTPKMFAPFGAKEWEPREPGKPSKWDLVLSFKGSSPMMSDFTKLLQAVDEANITHAFENQEAFFGEKGKSRDIIQDRYTPLVNNTNPKYEPKLTTKLDVKNGEYTGMVFDQHRQLQDLNYLDKMSYVQALVEFGSMWVVDKRFGQTIRTIQMMVHRQEQIRELAITPMDTDEDISTHTNSYDEFPNEISVAN